jgi:hypothetical protein
LKLFSDEKNREQLGARASEAVVRRRGVVDRCAACILEALK